MPAWIRSLVSFAAGPIAVFGIPFTGALVYSAFDQGLLLHRFYSWVTTLFDGPLAAIAIVALLGASSLIALTAFFRDD